MALFDSGKGSRMTAGPASPGACARLPLIRWAVHRYGEDLALPKNLPATARADVLQGVCSRCWGSVRWRQGAPPFPPSEGNPYPSFIPRASRIVYRSAHGQVGLSLDMVLTSDMVFTSPNGAAWTLHQTWREKLFEAERRYDQDPNDKTKAEYMQALKIFKDLVVFGIVPKD
jgi:hypothetical protein